jgi:16S rRNA (guanine966-N2)-methyltransferase
MSRVIAGVARGRRLLMPTGKATRPTSDRAREGLFSTLTSLVGSLSEVAFLDLYAGSGAVGLEAASRGAKPVMLVEIDPKALRTIRANVEQLDLPGIEVRSAPVSKTLETEPPVRFDVAFIDPPYDDPVDHLLARLVDSAWLAPDAVVCVERATRSAPPRWPDGLVALRSRRYGEATLCYGRRS